MADPVRHIRDKGIVSSVGRELGRECGPRAVVLRLKHHLERVNKCRLTGPTPKSDSAGIYSLTNSLGNSDSIG